MRQPHVDEWVRLNQDIPELALQAGQVGLVRSTWFSPTVAYEVEFSTSSNTCGTRALLLERQVSLADERATNAMFDSNLDIQAIQ